MRRAPEKVRSGRAMNAIFDEVDIDVVDGALANFPNAFPLYLWRSGKSSPSLQFRHDVMLRSRTLSY